jgi:plasmid stabilization system protein ParE
VNIRYTVRAAAELEAALAYIAEHSPDGARRVMTRLQAVVELLAQHPHAGRLTTKGNLRRIVAYPLSIPDLLPSDADRDNHSRLAPLVASSHGHLRVTREAAQSHVFGIASRRRNPHILTNESGPGDFAGNDVE